MTYYARRKQPYGSMAYIAVLVVFTIYALLDTFVIERRYEVQDSAVSVQVAEVIEASAETDDGASAEAGAASAEQDAETDPEVALNTYRYADTDIYVVEVTSADAFDLKAAFADDTFGKNVTAATSEIADSVDATVAVNGDFYGARNAGYVVRNGVLYRANAASADQEDLVIYIDGSFDIVREGDVSAEELVEAGAWQVFSFGPGLIDEGEIIVDADDEVGRAMASNPRTALGVTADGRYIMVVSDGRTSASEGLTLLELAQFMYDELGVTCAYNLDGGGSSTLYYGGDVVNNPTSNGNRFKERSVSDIVYLSA